MKFINMDAQLIHTVNEAIFNILTYYTCPLDCHAFCCKQYPIDITDREYNKLKRLSSEKIDKSKVVKYSKSKFHQLDAPCSFLGTDELCTAYNIRPERCRTFPFHMAECFIPCMEVYPCMMGKKIYKDYFGYKIYAMKRTNDTRLSQLKSEISLVLRDLDKISKSYYSSTDSNESIKLLGMPFNEILEFSNYLNDMKIDKNKIL